MFNARSIVNKLDCLNLFLKSQPLFIAFIVETWLKPINSDSFVIDNSYFSILRNDRLNDRGGGVAAIFPISLASKISSVQLDSNLCVGFEIIAFDFYFASSNFSRFICVYLPPCSAKNSLIVKNLIHLLNVITDLKSDVFILGDFNFNDIKWNKPYLTSISQPSFMFKSYLDSHFMKQLVNFPTQAHGNILDLFITSNIHTVVKVESEEPLTASCDHVMVKVKLSLLAKRQNLQTRTRNFFKGNYDKINSYLDNVDWNQLFLSYNEINQVYSFFTDYIHESIQKFIPFYREGKKPSVPKHLRHLAEIKNKVYKRIKTDSSYKILYKSLDSLYKLAVKNHMKYIEHKVLATRNKKSFYGFINRKLQQRSYLPPLINSSSETITEPKDKANLLNNQFSSVFVTDDDTTSPSMYINDKLEQMLPMEPVTITPSMVSEAIFRLKSSVSRTPDQVPAYFLKKVSSSMAKPLSKLFTLLLTKGKVPTIWKQAIVTPIFKKGLKSNPANYRPISLTSVICRILEIIIHFCIYSHLTSNNILSSCQHGFLPKRSSQSQQLVLLNDLMQAFDNKVTTDIIYLDFKKAFDSVSHSKLLHILKCYKLSQDTLNWIEDYLSQRCQITIVDGYFSEYCEVSSGVPQGSVLGPLLFLLFLEDLLQRLGNLKDVKVYAYADDVKLASASPKELQNAITVVEKWTKIWKLNINPSKSEHFIISLPSSTSTSPILPNKYYVSQIEIPQTDTVKDLGITLSSNLRFSPHISKIYSKSISLAYITLRSFKSSNPIFYVNLFKTYIRPITEYNCITWTPFLISDVKKIESIQKTFTRKLFKKLNLKYHSYTNRLEQLGLETLESRRIKFDLIYTYKIIHNLVDIPTSDFFKRNEILKSYSLRRHKFYLAKPFHPKSVVASNFFIHRAINIWNKLPDQTVSSPTLSLFKTRLNEFNFLPFCKYKL